MRKMALEIVKELREHGFETYWAGGCVRDLLMRREPKDYDIVTSAKPEEIEEILERTVPVGKKFGVILAIRGEYQFEIATFRSDSGYSDGRRPDAILFSNPKEDAIRRDFTVNGMFYDPVDKKVIDFVEGQKDLKNKTLRFIGDSEKRIQEDHLRILRAIRFKNALKFQYAPGTLEAIKKNVNLINTVSKERVGEELNKILLLPGRENAFTEMEKTGILKEILPELCELKGVRQPEKYHKEGDVFVHTTMALEALPDKVTPEVAWATLLHDVGKPATFKVKGRIRFNGHAEKGAEIVGQIGKRLRLSKNFIENVKWLVERHMTIGDFLKMKPTRMAYWINHPLFDDLLEVHRADALGSKPQDLGLYNRLKKLIKQRDEKLLPEPEILITGKEIMEEFKIPEGPFVGELLEAVRQAQMNEEITTKREAEEFIKSQLKK